MENVEAYANGSRVRLRWGNATGATLTDLSARIEWGSVDSAGSPDNDTQRSKEAKFSEVFRSGAWTNTTVVLEALPPMSLGFVRIKDVRHGGVRLAQ
jgi:hypothetical protein